MTRSRLIIRGGSGIAAAAAVFLLAQPLRSSPLAPTITANQTATIPSHPDGGARPGEKITYTISVGNTGTADASGVEVSDTLDSNTSLVSNSVLLSPNAIAQSFNAVGNTALSASLTTGVHDLDGVTSDANLVYAAGSTAPAHGNVSIQPNGSFTYTPTTGVHDTTDTFTYTVTDGDNLTSTGTVTINIGALVWYVDNTYGGVSDGSSAKPYKALGDVSGANGSDGAGDIIYVKSTGTAYNGNITLLNNQQLIGGGFALVVNGITVFPAGTNTSLVTTAASTNAITVAGGNTIKGFTIGDTTGVKLINSGSASVGLLAVSNVTLQGSGGDVSITNGGTLAITIDSLGSNSSTNAVTLASGGNLLGGTFTANGGAISGATGDAFVVNGGALAITYAGSITTTAAHSVNISNTTAGSASFSGSISDSGAGITLTNNSGTFSFTGGLALNTATNAAFTATNSGTVSATQNNSSIVNTISTTSGTALHVANTTIGAAGLTFRSISAGTSSGTSGVGIILDTTGTSAGLTVTGNATAASGGTIQHKTGSDNSTTAGIGIYLNSTKNVSLALMALHDFDNYAIRGANVNGFTMTSCTITGTNGNNSSLGDPNNEGSVRFDNLTGSALLQSSTIGNDSTTGGAYNTIQILNGSGTTLNQLTVLSCNLYNNNVSEGANAGNKVMLVGSSSGTNAAITVSIDNTNFGFISGLSSASGSRGELLQVNTLGTGVTNATITNNTFKSWGNNLSGSAALDISGGGAGTSVSVSTNIDNNIFVEDGTFSGGPAMNVSMVGGAGTIYGKITNNQVGDATVNSGTGHASADGIAIDIEGNNGSSSTAGALTGPSRFLVLGNIIQQYGEAGIKIDSNSGSATVNATVFGNTVENPQNATITNGFQTAFAGLWVFAGVNAADTNTVNVVVGDGNVIANKNKLAASDPNAQNDVFLENDAVGASATLNLSTNHAAAPISAYDVILADNVVSTERDVGTITLVTTLPSTPPLMFARGAVEPTASAASDHGLPDYAGRSTAASAINPASAPVVAGDQPPSQADLLAVVRAAKQRWVAAGLTKEQIAALDKLQFSFTDMPKFYLGEAEPDAIKLDRNAAGKGWFVGENTGGDQAFSEAGLPTKLVSQPGRAAAGRVDLLTAIMHEMGHALGLADTYANNAQGDVMYGFLAVGERRLPRLGQAIGAIPGTATHAEFLSLPAPDPGVTINPGTTIQVRFQATISSTFGGGAITNTATVSGSNFSPAVNSNQTTVTVNLPPTLFTAQTPPSAWTANYPYHAPSGYTFIANGFPAPAYTLSGGTIPGLSLSSAGVLSGTPTAASTYTNLKVTATNSAGSVDSSAFSITINPAINISTTTLADWTKDKAGYSQTISSTGGTGSVTFSLTAGTLPTGLSLGASTGTISGTPVAAGSYTFTITATDSIGATASQAYSVEINDVVSLSPLALPNGTAGTAYTQTVTASGGTGSKTMSVTNYSDGGTGLNAPITSANTVTFNSSPTNVGSVSFDLLATDEASATASQHYSFDIHADTTTGLVSNNNPSLQNDLITFTATVAPVSPATGTPTGTVNFIDTSNGNVVVCSSIALSGGHAECETSTLSAGSTHNIEASYSGDSSYNASTSNTVAQVVNACQNPATVTSTADDGSAGTLRNEVAQVCTNGTVNFAIPANDPGHASNTYTITLTRGELAVSRNMTIVGPNNNGTDTDPVVVSGNDASLVFDVTNSAVTAIDRLIVSHGKGDGTGGGAIHIGGATVTVSNSAITDSSANGGNGGGVAVGDSSDSGGDLYLINSTVSGNTAVEGGGLFSRGSGGNASITVVNSTISGNSISGNGAGISNYFNSSNIKVFNSTIANNATSGDGDSAGIYGSATLKNTIVVGGDSSHPDVASGPFTSLGHNFIGNAGTITDFNQPGDQAGSSSAVLNAQLQPLGSYGGVTNTMSLEANSPAVDRGADITTLSSAVDSQLTSSSLSLGDASAFYQGEVIQLDDEQMTVLTVAANVLTVTRAVNGTTAAAHAQDTGVNPAFDQRGYARKIGAQLDIGSVELQAIAADDSYSTDEDTKLDVDSASGVLANDSGAGRKTATVATAPSHASVFSMNTDGSFSYTPVQDYNGSDSFTYTLTADTGATATATVTLTINSVNDPVHTSGPGAATFNENQSATISSAGGGTPLSISDVDTVLAPNGIYEVSLSAVDGTVTLTTLTGLTFSVGGGTDDTSMTFHGTLSDINTALATAIFQPTTNFYGDFSAGAKVTIHATDSYNGVVATGSGAATQDGQDVQIQVMAVNQPPSFTKGPDQNVMQNSGPQSVTDWATNISAGPPNESTQTVNFIVTNNDNALFAAQPAIDSSGTLTYTPASNATGQATVSVQLHDNGGTANGGSDTSAEQTFTITVAAPTPTPTATPLPTATATPTPSATATASPSASVTPTPSATPAATATPTPTPTSSPTPTPAPPQPLNLSTRAFVSVGDQVEIGGLIITGNSPKKVLVRALGPSLNMNGELLDPILELHGPNGFTPVTNDDWQQASNASEMPQSLQPKDSRESAILITLDPGEYTAIIRGKSGSTGIALMEIYDAAVDNPSQLANLSTRALVQDKDNVLIGGFIIAGSSNSNVIVRALGPSLTDYGVTNVLADPLLEIHNKDGTQVTSNDNWQEDANASLVNQYDLAPGKDLESALYLSLPPGEYTAIESSANGQSGVGLIEIYHLQAMAIGRSP